VYVLPNPYTGAFIAIACNSSAPCTGTGSVGGVSIPIPPARDASAASSSVLARFKFKIKGHHKAKVKLTLTSAGKRLAKKGGRVKTTMTVVVKVHGRAVTTRVPVTPSFKKPHRH
jgi:hypothetical protein